MKTHYLPFLLLLLLPGEGMAQSALLTGKVIGSPESFDYAANRCSNTVNTIHQVFDGNFDTYFSACERTGGWVGLDFGKPYIITRIAFSPRKTQPERMVLGIIEGANHPDFGDAVPLHMIKNIPDEGQWTFADIRCSKGFRYVRYIGPDNVRCNLSELQFSGYPGEGDYTTMCQLTGLPTVVIHTTDHAEIDSKEIYRKGILSVISENGTSFFTDSLNIKGRGNSSWTFPKKPYRLKLYDKARLLNFPAKAKNWTLINNYGDKTLMRNLVAFEISKRFGMPYTPAGAAVDVIVNGDYKGTYQLCDKIEVGDDRVETEKMKDSDTALPALSGGYLIEIDAYADQEISMFYSAEKRIPVTVKYPKDDEIVPSQSAYIAGQFDCLEASLMSADYRDKAQGYRSRLHTGTFLKHLLIGELTGNTDTYWSVYLYKHRNDDLFYTGPVWDFDIAFDNDYRIYPISRHTDFTFRSGGSMADGMNYFVNRILSDPDINRELSEIWSQARNNGEIDPDSLNEFIDRCAADMEESQTLNFKRWKILDQTVHMNPKVYGSYAAEIKHLKDYLKQRIPWLDRKVVLIPTARQEEKSGTDGYISTGKSEVIYHGYPEGTRITLYNIAGQTVSRTYVSRSPEKIEIRPGLYIASIRNDREKHTMKIIVP